MSNDRLLTGLTDEDRRWLLDHGWTENAPTGRVVKPGRRTEHRCEPPDLSVGHGAIWRCDCGRRWRLRLTLDMEHSQAGEWRRWRLPWPR